MDYPWGPKELDMTERLSLSLSALGRLAGDGSISVIIPISCLPVPHWITYMSEIIF